MKQLLNRDVLNFLTALLLILGIAFVFSLIKVYLGSSVQTGEIIATVNGYEIYRPELEQRFRQMPVEMQSSFSEEMVLDQMIQETLLLQKMERLGLTVSSEEVDTAVSEYEESVPDLEQALQAQGLTRRGFRDVVKNQLLLEKLLQQQVFSKLDVTEDEIRDYYYENSGELTLPEAAVASHILIMNHTAEARRLANQLQSQSTPNNFCDLTSQYSADPENCGTYNVSRLSGLPETFVEAALETPAGNFTVTNSTFGWHVIYVREKKPEAILPLEEVRPRIRRELLLGKQKQAYREYLAMLRGDANISNKLLDDEIQRLQEVPEEFSRLDMQAICIGSKATLYGAKWDSVTREQISVFNESKKYLDYVECSQPGTLEPAPQCSGISAFPTWAFHSGREEVGLQPLQRVTRLAGCGNP